MAVREILLLGNPKLYESSSPVSSKDIPGLTGAVADLHDTLMDFRDRHGAGRAIAAPQIGVMKRLIYMHVDRPVTFLNPEMKDASREMMEVWDDCMCFPDLLVKVRRHRAFTISYLDLKLERREMRLEGDLSELLQHEMDHLEGILAVSRAMDGRSFILKSQKRFVEKP